MFVEALDLKKKNENRKFSWNNPFLSVFWPADDKASSEATGLRSGGRERHQGAQLLPLHGLGETGEQGGSAAVQTKSCKSESTEPKIRMSGSLKQASH